MDRNPLDGGKWRWELPAEGLRIVISLSESFHGLSVGVKGHLSIDGLFGLSEMAGSDFARLEFQVIERSDLADIK